MQCLVFTCGIAATQRVEGMFSLLPSTLSKNASLLHVAAAVEHLEYTEYTTQLATAASGRMDSGRDEALEVMFGHVLNCCNKHLSA